jgi:hypothetical protein
MMMTMATISWRGVNVVVEEGGSVGYVLYDTREPARSMTYAVWISIIGDDINCPWIVK